MLKAIFLASVMTIAAPVLAQTKEAPVSPATNAPMDVQTPPADDMTTSPTDTATAPTAQADPAPTATPTDVAGVVEKEFVTYDKDGSGSLSKVEFAAWMDALKAKSPDAGAADPKWNDAAFAQADSDKSKSVTKIELTGFLNGATATKS